MSESAKQYLSVQFVIYSNNEELIITQTTIMKQKNKSTTNGSMCYKVTSAQPTNAKFHTDLVQELCVEYKCEGIFNSTYNFWGGVLPKTVYQNWST